MFEPDSCPQGSSPAGVDWDYCPQKQTLAGCSCARAYKYGDSPVYYGTCTNIDNGESPGAVAGARVCEELRSCGWADARELAGVQPLVEQCHTHPARLQA